LSNITAIDLFCGAGGLTYGLSRAGIRVVAGYDVDPACKYPYSENNIARFIERDITEITPSELNVHWGTSGVRLLAGCAPCQAFSTFTQSRRRGKKNRWHLVDTFVDLINESRPELVTMENVPTLLHHRRFRQCSLRLKAAGYHVHAEVVDCWKYGLAQKRRRLVLLASRLGPVSFISASQFRARQKTVRQVIGAMPALTAGDRCEADHVHLAATLSPTNLARIRCSRPGGAWRDWPADLRARCHTRETGKKYSGVYGRMAWDEPSPTITTQCYNYGSGRFGHPDQDRAISLREAALLQSFPKNYKFCRDIGAATTTQLGRLIGNAVPVIWEKQLGNH
jgi:DNA (cytosine-5)-methyltransferase 1